MRGRWGPWRLLGQAKHPQRERRGGPELVHQGPQHALSVYTQTQENREGKHTTAEDHRSPPQTRARQRGGQKQTPGRGGRLSD